MDLSTRTALARELPRQLYSEVTNRCNSRCASCPLTYDHFLPFEPKQHLTWPQFRRIVDQLPRIDRAVLHGIGAPLLNVHLPDFVAHLKARGAHVLFNTNAVLLDERRGDTLREAGLDELRVSLDAATPALYHRLRGIDKFAPIVANLRAFVARPHRAWACYHTQLDTFLYAGIEYGIVGRVVGAPFAVLVAEELFAAGCWLIISITSAGQITLLGTPPSFVLIERALRDEGARYHELPPAPYSELRPELADLVLAAWDDPAVVLHHGASWTTDAPFRETEAAIAACRAAGILAVEMEAAALYALATAQRQDSICFAHVTNQMAQLGEDFEKGAGQGSVAALRVLDHTARQWRAHAHGQR